MRRARLDKGPLQRTFTIITGEPNALVRPLQGPHAVIVDRMISILWLTVHPDEAQSVVPVRRDRKRTVVLDDR